jgi:hypothetical protein
MGMGIKQKTGTCGPGICQYGVSGYRFLVKVWDSDIYVNGQISALLFVSGLLIFR